MYGAKRWIIGVLLVCVHLWDCVNTEYNIDSPLRVAQCRAMCLYQFGKGPVCQQSLDCSVCWAQCQQLQSKNFVWGAVCSRNTLCGPGCQEACRVHSTGSARRPPVLLTKDEEVVRFSDRTASWPYPGASGAPFVFVVMGRVPGKMWRQICQTLELTTQVPADVDHDTVRVLVVGKDGLVTVYSPQGESPFTQAQVIIKSLGKESVFGLHPTKTLFPNYQRRVHPDRNVSRDQSETEATKKVWRLHEVSVIHQKVLVLAEIAWDTQVSSFTSQPVYFVTWEVNGGVLRGNLFTDSTCVTLSLWPDTIYHIRVELVSPSWQREDQSELLILDTHHEQPTTTGEQPNRMVVVESQHTELVAGITAAVVMFLVVTLALTWRWHHYLALPHTKLIEEDSYTPNLYRVFPPAVTLVTEQNIPPLFSSTDNLLSPDCSSSSHNST